MARSWSETGSPDVLFRSLMDWVLQLPNVTQAPHRMGGTEFRVHGLEFMHSHGPSFLDVRLSLEEQARVLREGKAGHTVQSVNNKEDGEVSGLEVERSVERARYRFKLGNDMPK